MTEETMAAAKTALVAHGFMANEDGTAYTAMRGSAERTRYEVVDGGFKRFFRGEAMYHSLLPDWSGVSGLDGTKQPQAFQWVWPPEDIANIYG